MKGVEKIVRLAKRSGWRVERGNRGGHYKFFPVDKTKPMVVVSTTPEKAPDERNTLSRLRKAGLDV